MPTIKYIKINTDYLERCDIRCLQVFKELYSFPNDAKKLKGTIALGFPKYDKQNVVWAALPDVRNFIKKLDNKYPFIPYFLMPQPEVKQLSYYLQCLLPNQMVKAANGTYQMEIQPRDFLWLVYKKIETLIRFTDYLNDNSEEVLKDFLNGLPVVGNYTKNLQDLSNNINAIRNLCKTNFANEDPIESFEGVTDDEIYFK